mmetsp:Transcript_26403/g.86619  ORF Transcript_26403/g.86619 Transcript_26403/m.86619 type:complete len:267 (-) Transcript_26403:16-816(-)
MVHSVLTVSCSAADLRLGALRLLRLREPRLAALGERLGAALALLLDALREELLVRSGVLLGLGDTRLLDGGALALVLQRAAGHEALHLGRLRDRLLSLLERAAVRVHVRAHIVILAEREELADLGGTLRPAHARLLRVRKPREISIANLGDHKVEHREVAAHNAPAARLAPPLTVAPPVTTEARGSLRHQQAHAMRHKHTLLHGEALLVLPAHDLEDVALELVAKAVALNLLGDALVEHVAQLVVIVDHDLLLSAVRRVRDVELHR